MRIIGKTKSLKMFKLSILKFANSAQNFPYDVLRDDYSKINFKLISVSIISLKK